MDLENHAENRMNIANRHKKGGRQKETNESKKEGKINHHFHFEIDFFF